MLLSSVVGRAVFYNNSLWDGNNTAANSSDDAAIATDKSALLPGQTAAYSNITNFRLGINGVMVDISGLPSGTGPTASNFVLKVGTTADGPSAWSSAPAPASVTTRRGAGVGGSDRVTLTFADSSILKKWLYVRVMSDAVTGLTSPDVFYFGTLGGEQGDDPAAFAVTSADTSLITNHLNPNPTEPITSTYDVDKDRKVNALDSAYVQSQVNAGATLVKLTATPAAPSGAAASAVGPNTTRVSWADNSGVETQYRIDQSTTSNFASYTTYYAGADATSIDVAVTSHAVPGANNPYYYRVYAASGSSTSSYSATASENLVFISPLGTNPSTGLPYNDAAQINSAIASAPEGSVIVLDPDATYTLDQQVLVNRNVNIEGRDGADSGVAGSMLFLRSSGGTGSAPDNINLRVESPAENSQTLTSTATGGTFTLTLWRPDTQTSVTTAAIAYNATAAQVLSAVQAVLASGQALSASGGPLNTGPVTVVFSTYANIVGVNTGSLTGGTASFDFDDWYQASGTHISATTNSSITLAVGSSIASHYAVNDWVWLGLGEDPYDIAHDERIGTSNVFKTAFANHFQTVAQVTAVTSTSVTVNVPGGLPYDIEPGDGSVLPFYDNDAGPGELTSKAQALMLVNNPTTGTFQLTVNRNGTSQTTASIAAPTSSSQWSSKASDIQTALTNLSIIGSGGATVTLAPSQPNINYPIYNVVFNVSGVRKLVTATSSGFNNAGYTWVATSHSLMPNRIRKLTRLTSGDWFSRLSFDWQKTDSPTLAVNVGGSVLVSAVKNVTVSEIDGNHMTGVGVIDSQDVTVKNFRGTLLKNSHDGVGPYGRAIAVWQNRNLVVDGIDVVSTEPAPVIYGESYERNFVARNVNVQWRVKEQQTIAGTATGGTFTLNLRRPDTNSVVTTGSLAYNATAAQVQTALQAVLGSGQVVSVTGDRVNNGSNPVVVVFGTGARVIDANLGSLTGGGVWASTYDPGSVFMMTSGCTATIEDAYVDNLGYRDVDLWEGPGNVTMHMGDVVITGHATQAQLPGTTGPMTMDTLSVLPKLTTSNINPSPLTFNAANVNTSVVTQALTANMTDYALSVPQGRIRKMSVQLINTNGTAVTSSQVTKVFLDAQVQGAAFNQVDSDDLDGNAADLFQGTTGGGTWTGRQVDVMFPMGSPINDYPTLARWLLISTSGTLPAGTQLKITYEYYT